MGKIHMNTTPQTDRHLSDLTKLTGETKTVLIARLIREETERRSATLQAQAMTELLSPVPLYQPDGSSMIDTEINLLNSGRV